MMPLIDRLGDALARWLDRTVLDQRSSPGFGVSTSSYQLNQPRWPDSNILEYRKAFASQVAVYACVLKRANSVSQATLRVYQEQDGDATELPKHALRSLMRRPNPMMSEAEWLVTTVMLMDATGFAAIEKERAQAGNIIGLWHLRSDWLKEIRRKNEPSDWEYRVPGNPPKTINAENILVIPGGPSTDLGSTGMSPIAVALREVGIDTAMTDFLKIFIDRGGVPQQALTTSEQINDQQKADEIRGRFEQAYGGYKNWAKVALLSGGLDVKKIGLDMNELAYPELRALTETHICSVFGVEPILVGIQAGLDAATYSNYAQARRAFFEGTVSSLWSRLDGALERGLLPEFTDDPTLSIAFDVSAVPALQEDQTQLWERTGGLLARGGLTLNQAQNALGLPGFGDEGDVLYLPISVQPTRPEDLSFMADQVTEPPQPVPAALQGGEGDATSGNDDSGDAGGEGDDGAGDGGDRSRNVEHNGRNPLSPAREQGEDSLLSSTKTRILTLPIETRSRIVTANRRGVSRLTAKFAPRLAAMYRRQGKTVVAAVKKRFDDGMETRDLTDIPWDDLEAETLRELNGLYEASGRMAFIGAAKAVGVDIDWSLSNPKIRQTMLHLARRVVGINNTTRVDVARVVTAGIEEGLSTPQIAERLTGLFTETYKGRAMTIARTESQMSYNLATADAYRESGVVMAMTLHDNELHTEDYGASDGLSCAERNGVITDVDQVQIHIFAEHPNGSLAVSPLLVRPLGDE